MSLDEVDRIMAAERRHWATPLERPGVEPKKAPLRAWMCSGVIEDDGGRKTGVEPEREHPGKMLLERKMAQVWRGSKSRRFTPKGKRMRFSQNGRKARK